MNNERLPKTSFTEKGKAGKRVRRTAAMLALAVTGFGVGSYPWEGRSGTPTLNNPAATAEQNAVDFVNAVHENPSVLDDKDTSAVTLEDGDSVNSATQRAAEEVGEQEGWSADQKNLNIGVIAEASQEVRHTNSEKTGTAYNISKVGDTVTVVREDVNGDGTKEFFPVDVQPK